MPSNARPLGESDLHIWYRSLDSADAQTASMLRLLSEDEKQRASRYRYDQHRNEFILSRGTLRLLLASYLGSSAEGLSFAYSEHSKPMLAENCAAKDLNFNLSHTHGMLLLGVVRGRRIGVDVEEIRSDFDVRQIAERFFSADEQDLLRDVPDHEQFAAFFRCWTRKEAYIKAKGEGMSIPLRDFDVSLDSEDAALVGTRPDETEVQRWRMVNLPIAANYAAAAAIEAERKFEFELMIRDAGQ